MCYYNYIRNCEYTKRRHIMEKFKIMKLKDFAKELKTPESTIRTWKRRGDIPAECFVEIAATIFIRVEVFQDWIDGSNNRRQII